MTLPVPVSLSPSKINKFTQCGAAFYYSAIEQVPQKPSYVATKGSLVHRALEILHSQPPDERTQEDALECLDDAFADLFPSVLALNLDAVQGEILIDECRELIEHYYELEDPTEVHHAIGIELFLSHPAPDHVLRGIIDRLDWTPEGLHVIDYKTGKAPKEEYALKRFDGLVFYAWLIHRCFGVLPKRVSLYFLADPCIISIVPTLNKVNAFERKAGALWDAVVRACETSDFRPRPGGLCEWHVRDEDGNKVKDENGNLIVAGQCDYKGICPAWN